MMKECTYVCAKESFRRNLLILHAITEDSPWCGSCIKENSTGFERFVQVEAEAFADIPNDCDTIAHACSDLKIQSVVEQSREPWVLLLYGNVGLEYDFLVNIQQQLIAGHSHAVIYAERSMEDGTAIYMPQSIKYVPYDVLGKFPSNLLIRKTLLEEILRDPRGNFLPNPILGILRVLINRGITIEGKSEVGIIHNAPMNCIIGQCGLYEWNQWSKRKRILVLTHELNRTGAPIVLQEACINVLKPAEYELFVASPVEGPMLKDYLQANIPVVIMPSLLNKDLPHTSMLADAFDLVIVNTNVLWAPACVLNTMNIPVLWWIHDAESGYRWVDPYMPKSLAKNIHVYCVGGYAKEALLKHQPGYHGIQTLIYGVKDQKRPCILEENRDEQTVFVSVGSIADRKGQDILCKAIELLPEEVRKRCLFRIVGKNTEKAIYQHVEKACKKYPEQVEYLGEVTRAQVYQMYRQADCVICASRDDPMPTFVAEGMMFSTPSICSENTGTAKVLKNGVDGLVYERNNPRRLAEAIQAFVQMTPESRAEMSAQARKTFLREFELERFKKNLVDAVKFCMYD